MREENVKVNGRKETTSRVCFPLCILFLICSRENTRQSPFSIGRGLSVSPALRISDVPADTDTEKRKSQLS